MKHIIYTSRAPSPVGPYSQAICIDGWLFVSGQIPIDPNTGKIVKGGFTAKAERTLKNVISIVEESGGSTRDIVKITVYMRDLSLFEEFNKVYKRFFPEGEYPARVVVGVASLPKNADLEIEAIARLKEGCKNSK